MGLSQKQLAARLGVARATVWRWENGVNPIEPLSARLLAILARGAAAEPPSKPPADTR
jgi:transcriptional regulator with XRE-family HTH domain